MWSVGLGGHGPIGRPMFDGLTQQISGVFDRLSGRGVLSEKDVAEALAEVRTALLEADVALPVVKDFIAKAKVRAGFEFLSKLGVPYCTFHDRDIAPEGATLTETNRNLDEIVDLVEELMKETGIKLLWGTANLFSNIRYMNGAATNPDVHSFAYAGAQVKKMLEITKRYK